MGTVTQYNLQNIQTALGGANPISINEYYRGGLYVPTTRTTVVREPATGTTYNPFTTVWYWRSGNSNLRVYWGGVIVYNVTAAQSVTTVTVSGTTYFRGALTSRSTIGKGDEQFLYGIYRTYSSTVSINTGVPSSGTISISQLYGAANP